MAFQLKSERPILILGDVNPDIVIPYGEAVSVLKAIAKGEPKDTNHLGVFAESGGTCGNTASGCGRLGVPTLFMGKAGNDGFGRMLRDDLIKDHVDTRYMMLDEKMFTCLVLAVVGEDNDRCLFVWPKTGAAHHQLIPEEFPDSLMDEISIVHTTGISLRDEPAASTVVDFMERCKKHGIPVSLDLNLRIESRQMGQHFWDIVRRAVAASTIILGSTDDEFCPLANTTDPMKAITSLSDGSNVIIARNGAKPVNVIEEGIFYSVPAFSTNVVDTIGAGDTFNSGFLSALYQKKSVKEAVEWGNACAAYSLQFKGGRNCPTLDQMATFMKKATLNQI